MSRNLKFPFSKLLPADSIVICDNLTFNQSDQWRMSIGAQEQYLYFAIGLYNTSITPLVFKPQNIPRANSKVSFVYKQIELCIYTIENRFSI